MFMVLAGTASREEVEMALERAGVSGYTEVDARRGPRPAPTSSPGPSSPGTPEKETS